MLELKTQMYFIVHGKTSKDCIKQIKYTLGDESIQVIIIERSR
jgi:hypothetical protein